MTAGWQHAELLATGLAALALAAVVLAGGRLHPLSAVTRDQRKRVSFCAGMAAAYVFVHVMPELQGVRLVFVESASVQTRFEGMAIYAVALIGFMTFYGLDHLAVDHALSEEHGEAYARRGRYWLAAMVPLGWAVGQLLALPLAVVALLVAFLSGAVIVNSSLMELPSEKEGHFVPFLAGGLLYALILLPLG